MSFLSAPSGFFRKAILSFTFRFGGLGLQFLTSVVIARILGVEAFGAYTYAFTWASIIGMMLTLGMSDLAVRELPLYLSQGRIAHLRGYLLTACGVIALTTTMTALILLSLQNTGILELAPGWLLVSLMAGLHALILILSQSLNGFQRILTSQFIETIIRQLLYILLIAAAFVIGVMLSPKLLLQLALLGALPVIIIMSFIVYRSIRAAAAAQALPPAPRAYEFRVWFAAAIPLLMTNFAQIMQSDLDTLMVGFLLTDADVGLYRVAARGAILVSIANMVALQLVGPMLSRAIAQNDEKAAQKLLTNAAVVSFLAGAALCLVFGIGAGLYTSLFGPEFSEAARPLQLLLIGQFLHVLVGPSALLLVMLRYERRVLIVNAIAVGMNFVLNLTLIGPLGIEGAAIATVSAAAFSAISFLIIVKSRTQYDPTIWSLLRRAQ